MNLFHFSLEIANAIESKRNRNTKRKKKQINSQIYELNCHLFIFRHFKKLHTSTKTLLCKVLKRLVQRNMSQQTEKVWRMHAKEKRNTCGRFTNCTHRVLYALHLHYSTKIAHIQKITTSKPRTATKVERAQIYIIAVIMPYFNVRSMLFSLSFSDDFGCICIWFGSYAVASIESTCYILWFQCLTWNSAISH